MNRIQTIIAAIVLFSCTAQKEEKTVEKYANAQSLVLMHNPMGMRAQYIIDNGNFDIWYSPKAKTSVDYYDRNFSNRDDFMSIFDKISIPGLPKGKFKTTQYDPFYSQVVFEHQTMHIATFINEPAFAIWFDESQAIDIKTENEDTPITRTDKKFIVQHPDRRYTFDFIAQLGDGSGSFVHQLVVDEGRSTYTRANLSPGQVIILAADLTNNGLANTVNSLLNTDIQTKIKEVSTMADSLIRYGQIDLKGHEDLEKLMDVNRRIWYSMQDHGGSIRASIKEIYYLIWVRDGGMATSFIANAGWVEPLEKWTKFQLANPTYVTDEKPQGRFFGQLVNPITKWEEDGLFYAVWSAFTYWTQTGDQTFVSGENLKLMEDATKWLEDYLYDEEQGLFVRYHYCETPLKNSRGYHWDNAVGKPVDWEPGKYKGKDIIASYDIYMNLLNYSVYNMLAAMHPSEDAAKAYLEKAMNLEKNMKKFFPEDEMPRYGDLLTLDSTWIETTGFGYDRTDYYWALSLPYFLPEYFNEQLIGDALLDSLIQHPGGQFLAGYFSAHASLDPHRFDQQKMMDAMEYAGAQSYKPGKHLPMAYSIIEMLDQEDGNPYHDIRPQPFSIGTWFGAISNFGVRRSPFGISVRANNYIEDIKNYQYRGSEIDFNWEGTGKINEINIDGDQLKYSYQIPLDRINQKEITITAQLSDAADSQPALSYSTVELLSISEKNESVQYRIKGYGLNNITFENANLDNLMVVDEEGNSIDLHKMSENAFQHLRFWGKGEYIINMSK